MVASTGVYIEIRTSSIVIFKLCFLEFEFILFLLCSLICNYGVTLAVLFLYPVTTKDTCIFLLSLF